MITLEIPLDEPAESAVEAKPRTGPGALNPDGKSHLCAMTRCDYAIIGVLLLLLFPAFHMARLPMRFDFAQLAHAYWIVLTVCATFSATVLAVLGLPVEQTLIPSLRQYRERKIRIALVLALVTSIFYVFGFWIGLVVAINAIGLKELLERRKKALKNALAGVFFPALYLFFGLMLIFAFNHAIAGMRYAETNDAALERLDWLLFHARVSGIADWSLNHLPLWFMNLLQYAYMSLSIQIGAAIILIALLGNQRYAVKYVRTLLICYSMALVLFLLWPAKGPYSICPVHLSGATQSWPVFRTQVLLINRARMLWAHILPPGVATVNGFDYFISFPCMHVALPSIVIWFLRPWKRIALILLVLDSTLLVPSIILLNWHYLIDLLGGFAVAFLSIYFVHRFSKDGFQNELQKDDSGSVSRSAMIPAICGKGCDKRLDSGFRSNSHA